MSVDRGRASFRWGLFNRYWRSIIRSSAVGTLVGSVPGAGGNIASFISYALGERRTGKNFSRGSVEGVVCCEVANNANVGGGLVPTITLGIPGNNSAAMFLAILTLQGITVGPTIQFDQPGLLQFFLVSLVVANIGLIICAPLVIRSALAALRIPLRIIMPAIIVLAVTGTYAASNSVWDLWVMLAAGVIGLVLKRGGYPKAPIMLGMILGPVIDENLRRALLIADGNPWQLLSRPVGDILLVALILTFAYGIRYMLQESPT